MVLGSDPSSDDCRNLFQPGLPQWTMDSDLRFWYTDDSYIPEPAEEKPSVAVPGVNCTMRCSGVFQQLCHGDHSQRYKMVGLQRLFSESAWQNLCGVVFTYLVAPVFDEWLQRFPNSLLRIITVILLILFNFDLIYSSAHPNTGEGITAPKACEYTVTYNGGCAKIR